MAAASAASGKVAAAQSQLSALEAANADYDELQERYAAFTVNSLSDVEKALADRGAILDLLQGTVANMAELQSVNVTGNTVMLQFATPRCRTCRAWWRRSRAATSWRTFR